MTVKIHNNGIKSKQKTNRATEKEIESWEKNS
jgi:hypothetical protein